MKKLSYLFAVLISLNAFGADALQGAWKLSSMTCSNGGTPHLPEVTGDVKLTTIVFQNGVAMINVPMLVNGSPCTITVTQGYQLNPNQSISQTSPSSISGCGMPTQTESTIDTEGGMNLVNSTTIVATEAGEDTCPGGDIVSTYVRQ